MNEGQEMEEQFALLLETLKNQQMNEFRELFLALHIYEQGQFYQSLDEKDRQHLYNYLSPKELADMFDVIEEDNENMKDYLAEMRPSYAADMLAEMYTDNAVDLLNMLDKSQKAKYLSLLSSEEAGEIKELLHYEDETAGAIMTTEFVSIVANQTVRSAMYVLKNQADMAETIYYVYVVDQENHLVGVISLRDLIVNDDDTLIADILNNDIDKLQHVKTLVLQPNNREDDLRKWLAANDFEIVAEDILTENDKCYEILVVKHGHMN